MSKKIKKQIKRSMPLFLIFSLIMSSTVAGLVFNLNLNISSMTLSLPEAKADSATTSVTVRNAPPAFSVSPAEVVSSTSSSPVNVGGVISFNVTANDPENAQYYLIVCSSNSATAVNGGEPTCGATEFCTSALTNDETQTSCTYSDVADPSSEMEDWYAFVCDAHASEAECSVASQGANPNIGDNSSPFYVNHAPTLSSAATTDDNKDPGGTFTVTASVADADVADQQDELYIYVCPTNSWATSTGCTAPEWCSGTSTSPDVSCGFATTTPAIDGEFSYFTFVKDWHGLAASGNSKTGLYHVNNVAPSVSNVIINGSNNIQLNIKGAAEVAASTTSASISDNNGCTDLVSATSTIYWSAVTDGQYCSADDDNCYQIASVNCEQVAGSCTGSGDAMASYICTTTLAYHAVPTDGATGNPYTANNWLGAITASDEALSGTAVSASGIDVITSPALEVATTTIAYGQVRAGDNTGTTNAPTTIVNYGNSPLDSDISGTNMTKGGDSIGVTNQEYSLTSGFNWSTGTDLALTSATVDIVSERPTSSADITDILYWGIGIPGATPSGDYGGTNTFSAALDTDGDWN